MADLSLYALASCDQSGVRPALDDLVHELGGMILALGDQLGGHAAGTQTMAVELVRLGLYFATSELPAWLELAARLYDNVLPRIEGKGSDKMRHQLYVPSWTRCGEDPATTSDQVFSSSQGSP